MKDFTYRAIYCGIIRIHGVSIVVFLDSPPQWIYILDKNKLERVIETENQCIREITSPQIRKKPTIHENLNDSTVLVCEYRSIEQQKNYRSLEWKTEKVNNISSRDLFSPCSVATLQDMHK